MTDPVVLLDRPRLSVDPGESVSTTLTITNVGDQVEGYTVEVCRGVARAWSAVMPRTIELMPGQRKDVVLTIRPPRRPAAPSGEFPVGVLVVSRVDSSRRTVVECDVAVGAIHGLTAHLVTVKGRGRHRGRFRLDIDNVGTAPAIIHLEPGQPGDLLSFALQPADLDIPAGRTASAYLLVRPIRPTLLGRPENNPFWLTYRAQDPQGNEDAAPAAGRVEGGFVRLPVVPRALLAVAGAVVLLGGAGIAAALLLIPRSEPPALTQVVPKAPFLREVRSTPGGISITWERTPLAASYAIEQLASAGSTDVQNVIGVDAALSTTTLRDLPEGEHCFRVVAINSVGRSVPSDSKCAPVVAAPAAASASPTGGFVLFGKQFPQADVQAYPRANASADELQAMGVQARVVDSTTTSIRSTEPMYLVVVDGFADLPAAQAYCDLLADRVECSAYPPSG